MKITRTQLQEYFTAPLPPVAALADAFTFHAFEIESIEGDLLDIKVLPNRAADCATAEGVARELAAILDMPMKGGEAPEYTNQSPVAVTVAGLNAILGADFSREEILDVFRRLQFKVAEEGETMRVTAPLPRTDIVVPEDVAEEVGQILGYERIIGRELAPAASEVDQNRYRGIERMKDQLVEQGFAEVSTQSFAPKGDILLANPLDKTKPALRTSLEENLADALARAKLNAPRVLAPGQKPKLFEVGTVFPQSGEFVELRMTEPVVEWGVPAHDNLSVAKLEDYGKDYTPKRYELGAYQPFSIYPFITRDIAFWIPKIADTDVGLTMSHIWEQAGALLVKLDQFDRFEKEGKVSYAYRLVFESPERTLTDDEVNAIMEKISLALAATGFEVR